jgi:nucleotide-binding universal stress UspA family protein
MARTQLQRILIAVDDTVASDTAVEQGLALAAAEGAEVILAHVAAIAGEWLMPHGKTVDRVPAGAQSIELEEAAAKAEAVGVPYTTELLVGYPPRQIALLANESDVDLVIVGSRHRSGLKRFLIGSTSRALIAETTRPMLIVPDVALDGVPV